jgi:hypothetical protein
MSPTPDHFFRNACLVSRAERSLGFSTPSLSEARAFQIRRLPSSLPDRTKRASRVKAAEKTLGESRQ